MLDGDAFEEATWGYQIQQATEKALKAWISSLGHHYPRTHDLALLFALICDLGADPTPFQPLVSFTLFAVLRRYDEEPEQVNLDRPLWTQICADLLDQVASLLP